MTRQGWQCPLCEVVHNPETKVCGCKHRYVWTVGGVKPAVCTHIQTEYSAIHGCHLCADLRECANHDRPTRSGTAGRRAMDHIRERAADKSVSRGAHLHPAECYHEWASESACKRRSRADVAAFTCTHLFRLVGNALICERCRYIRPPCDHRYVSNGGVDEWCERCGYRKPVSPAAKDAPQ